MSVTRFAATWTSFHLFLPEPLEPFLANHLYPALTGRLGPVRVRRFFFIRYREGGLHLRLRFRLHAGVCVEAVFVELERCALAYLGTRDPRGTVRLERHPYDRSALYFGETTATVYSELLNEATSWLALRLLRAPQAGEWRWRWLLLAATLDLLQRASSLDEARYRSSLGESIAFARLASAELGFAVPEREESGGEALDQALGQACRRAAAAMAHDPAVLRAVRLLRRLRRHPFGAGGASHALHLLCNKLGFSLGDEHHMFIALERLARSQGATQRRTG